ncbi:MAG: hypothetical protein HEEMFOPI_00950 [Holosporales bacterium]
MVKKNKYFLICVLFLGLSFENLAISQKEESLKKDVTYSKNKKNEYKTVLTLYSDLAVVERHLLNFVFEKNLQKVAFLNLPKEMLDHTVFFNSDDKLLAFLESYFDEFDQKKDFYVTIKNSDIESSKDLVMTFATKGITWMPHYCARFSNDFEMLSLEGWIDIHNQTNTNLKEAKLCIIDSKSTFLNDESEKTDPHAHQGNPVPAYEIGEGVFLKEKSQKRFGWVKYNDMPTTKEYRLDMGGSYLDDLTNKDLVPMLELWITCVNKDKMLPQGALTIYRQNAADGRMEALTKITLPFIKQNDLISFKMPGFSEACQKTLPVKVAYEQTEFQRFTGKIVETANRLTFQNITDQPISIKVFINFPTEDGIILRESIPHQTNGSTFFWVVDIPVHEKVDLKYRVRFSQTS